MARFLDLPTEIRVLIYKYLFCPNDEVAIVKLPNPDPAGGTLKNAAAILRTCTRCHDEACPILYRSQRFALTMGLVDHKTTTDDEWVDTASRLISDLRKWTEKVGSRNLAYVVKLTIWPMNLIEWLTWAENSYHHEKLMFLSELVALLILRFPNLRTLVLDPILLCDQWLYDCWRLKEEEHLCFKIGNLVEFWTENQPSLNSIVFTTPVGPFPANLARDEKYGIVGVLKQCEKFVNDLLERKRALVVPTSPKMPTTPYTVRLFNEIQ